MVFTTGVCLPITKTMDEKQDVSDDYTKVRTRTQDSKIWDGEDVDVLRRPDHSLKMIPFLLMAKSPSVASVFLAVNSIG